MIHKLLIGNVIDGLKSLDSESIDLVITSTPYWGLRDYGDATKTIWGGKSDCEHNFEVNNDVKVIKRKESHIDWDRPSRRENSKVGNNFKCVVCEDDFKGKLGQKFCSTKCLNTLSNDDRQNSVSKQQFCSKCNAWFGQLGLEPDYRMFIDHIVEVCREIKRVLKKSGSFYLNLGDTYSSKSNWKNAPIRPNDGPKASKIRKNIPTMNCNGVKTKCLMKIPQRVELRLIDELGFIERNDIIWHKPNHMPSSVQDRLTSSYEHIFHFVKSQKYYYDLDIIRVPCTVVGVTDMRPANTLRQKLYPKSEYHKSDDTNLSQFKLKQDNVPGRNTSTYSGFNKRWKLQHNAQSSCKGINEKGHSGYYDKEGKLLVNPKGKNPGDVWDISTQPYPDAHFATYPEKLILKPILSSCIIGGVVLDPFGGSGTTAKVARDNGRNSICIEINPDYEKFWRKRLRVGESLDVEYVVEKL